jgi:hypothetical protein
VTRQWRAGTARGRRARPGFVLARPFTSWDGSRPDPLSDDGPTFTRDDVVHLPEVVVTPPRRSPSVGVGGSAGAAPAADFPGPSREWLPAACAAVRPMSLPAGLRSRGRSSALVSSAIARAADRSSICERSPHRRGPRRSVRLSIARCDRAPTCRCQHSTVRVLGVVISHSLVALPRPVRLAPRHSSFRGHNVVPLIAFGT